MNGTDLVASMSLKLLSELPYIAVCWKPMHLTVVATIHLFYTKTSLDLHFLGRLCLLEIHENGKMNAGEKVPVHERIIPPLIVRSEHIVLHLFRNQFLIGCNAKVLVGNALELEGILIEDSACFHCLHADEGAEPEVEGSPEEINVGVRGAEQA